MQNKNTIKLSNIMLGTDFTQAMLESAILRQLRLSEKDVESFFIIKKSLDARKKPDLKYNLSVGVNLGSGARVKGTQEYDASLQTIEGLLEGLEIKKGDCSKKVVVVGSGPAGLFCALILAKAGLKPIVIERGESVQNRVKAVQNFNDGGSLNPESNIQFGEGGAGTFSDGKLSTGIGGALVGLVLKTFVRFGASEEVGFLSKPHIGTDKLVEVVKNIRVEIENEGGTVYFSHKLNDFLTKDGKVVSAVVEGGENAQIDCDTLVIAIGHSARDTYKMLVGRGVEMQQKPFAVGVRIEHLQEEINVAQYGRANVEGVGAADYKLAGHFGDKSCFSFCMCPGGYVVAGASEEGGVVTNGMSFFARKGRNANAALLVGVDPHEFGSTDVLAGIEFQRRYERLAFDTSKDYRAPCQKVGDFLQNKVSDCFGAVQPTYPRGVVFGDIRGVLPKFVTDTLAQGLVEFDKKIKGFAQSEALLTGVETRSSAPVRILRDENFCSNIRGLYPCGEGAGFAGGITSACIDGIKTALAILGVRI